jgi:hypothetical protein
MMLACLLAAAACGKSGGKGGGGNEDKIAQITVKKLAYEAYPQWSMQNPTKQCPASLAELSPYMNNDDLKDPWGHSYVMMCGASAPPDARGFGVTSLGPDGAQGGGDDLDSWSK